MAHRRFRYLWWLLVPAAVLALVGSGGLRLAASRAQRMSDPLLAREHQEPIPVRTSLVSAGPVTTVVGATAVTVPSAKITIRIGSSRRLREFDPVVQAVHVHDGSYVHAEEVLFDLEPALFELAVAQKKKALAAAEARLALAEAAVKENGDLRAAELENATEEVRARAAHIAYRKEDYERLSLLHERQVASETERLEAASAYVETQAELTKARVREQTAKTEMVLGPLRDQQEVKEALGAVHFATFDLALAEMDRRLCRLCSPFDGCVNTVSVTPGQAIDSTTILGEVLRVDPIHVRLDFPQERIAELSVGLVAEVVFDTFPQETFQGVVARIPAQVDQQTRALPVIVEVPNPDHRIKLGVSGYVRVRLAREATTAPAIAVIDLDADAMAFVVQDGRAHVRKVKTGRILETGVLEIAEGLREGEEIVVYGQQFLQENDRVNTNWRQWARRD